MATKKQADESQNGDDAEALRIDASPTKELFVEMLTRDVALIPAIIDLADNCTDGARRIRRDKSWSGLFVDIEAKPEQFVIDDNAGGMSVKDAREYAFRFGRPSKAKTVQGEVGRFGVGMKRGLFKLGRHFTINSTTETDQFNVTIDVDQWVKNPKWEFEFDEEPTEDGDFPEKDRGTRIVVTRLHSQVKQYFQESGFIDDLREQLTSKLEESILKGLAVTVNRVALKAHVRKLVSEKQLAPARKTFALKGPTGKKVDVELWCGLGRPESKSTARDESGWYVFCNGRMLLQADKTTATGWGVEDDESIPAYHPQFNDFRGFAYLDAGDGADLPWNTTKTALDTDHPVYRRVKQEMIAIGRPVIDYFNARKEENDALRDAGEEQAGRLQSLLEKAPVSALEDITPRKVFRYPEVTVKKSKGPKMQRICFEREQEIAEAVKEGLGVRSWRAVGEEVFDYYYNAEHGDA